MHSNPPRLEGLEPPRQFNIVTMAREAGHKPKPQLKPKSRRHWLTWRRGIQLGFALLNLVLGYQFYQFVRAAQTTSSGPLPVRPPGVEGWLPISGLMGVIDWIHAGAINMVHPAATILFLAFLAISFAFRKAFCSWLCPIGTLSDGLAKLGRRLFGRNFLPPRWLDRVLLSLKYILLGFFVSSFFLMGLSGISAFLQSPYNQIVDVKMLLFFVQIGTVGALVILALAIASVFIRGFWCRYLCPYGAMLGLVSWMSPVKVRRNTQTCIDCAKCDKICPARLPIMAKASIRSVECTGCMECVEVCPVENTLHLGTPRWKPSLRTLGISVAALFLLFVLSARLFGVWHGAVSDDAYRYHVTRLNQPEYGHPGMNK